MKFKAFNPNRALSACGNYEIRGAMTNESRKFYNAWHVPTGTHIEASFEKAKVISACDAHALKAV